MSNAELMRPPAQENYQGRTKLAHRLFYSASIFACEVARIRTYVRKIGGTGILPNDVRDFWHGVNQVDKINDMLYNLGGQLCKDPNIALDITANRGVVGPVTSNVVLGSAPDRLLQTMIDRANRNPDRPKVTSARHLDDQYDFIGRFPASRSAYGPTKRP